MPELEPQEPVGTSESARRGTSRRAFLGRAAAAGAGAVVVGGAGGFGLGRATEGHAATKPNVVPFYGQRQAGIATTAQDRLAFAAFDVKTFDSQALQGMLGRWAAAAALMTQGQVIGPTETLPQNPPIDTGEAVGLGASNLTITVGFGASLFDDRFGLKSKRPAALIDLPAFGNDSLQASLTGGDICVQACSDDPTVAFHVIRNFARIARDGNVAALRWSQLGFGRTSSTSTDQSTPRNLMGFKDGTNNLKAEETAEMEKYVWVGSDTDQKWMQGGSYLVARRIRMFIENWDHDYIADQEKVFGRIRDTGAPLTGKKEFDTVQLGAKTSTGELVIDPDAHIRLASPASHGGMKILRRGYSYTDGIDNTGALDAGLFFICFNRDSRTQFVPIQRALGSKDLLNEYITHTGGGLFAVPPGVTAVGDWFGKGLFT